MNKFIDSLYRNFFPNAYLRRTQRLLLQRTYDAALDSSSEGWTSARATSANQEISSAGTKLLAKSRDLVRNNPYAKKALSVIVTDTIGYGIMANIKGPHASQVETLKKLWTDIAESTKCDAEGRLNFYGLQALALSTMVESGEVLGKKVISPDSPSIQLLEPEFLDSTIDDTAKRIYRGIKLDENNRRLSYFLHQSHPSDVMVLANPSKEIPASNIIHLYKQDRTGQLRGVPWSHAVIETLKDLGDFNYSTIIRQKIAACLVGVITKNGNDNLLPPDVLKEKREAETKMSPGSYFHANPGEDVKFSTPPPTQGYSEFTRENLRGVAAGFGITYESLTGDYSQVNFSSGRLGHLQARKNIDFWRWNIVIPTFCDVYFKWFLEWAKLRGYKVDGITVEWVPPAHSMIDPSKETAAEKDAVKAGFKSRSMVIREAGFNPDMMREEIKKEQDADKQAGLMFDTTIAVSAPVKSEAATEPTSDDSETPDIPDDNEPDPNPEDQNNQNGESNNVQD
jgi:lambda family phage portal protein